VTSSRSGARTSAVTPHGPVGDDSDASAFANWIRPHWVDLQRLALRMCGPSDGEDVLQDALAAAWRKRHQFDPERGTARAWLLAVVADRARKQRLRSRLRPSIEFSEEVGGEPALAPDLARVDLTRVLRQLAYRQRLAISLYYYVDLPVAEIAQVMNCSIGTVKSTLSDGRRRLHALLGDDY
jgi:RNA polymerase sigma-70 factor (ECF subfamily)